MSGKSSFRAGLVASFVAAACLATVARAEPPDFQCYAAATTDLVDRTLTLTDQFGQIEARIEVLERICNPTDTNNENPDAVTRSERMMEYTLRPLSGYIEPRYVSVTDRFGTLEVELRHHLPARSLLMPSTLSSTPPAPGPLAAGTISHYTCYHMHPLPRRTIERVALEDEIGAESFTTRAAEELCVPVKVDDADVVAGDPPLMCYIMRRNGERLAPRFLYTTDEFGSRAVDLQTGRWQHLCVAATVSPLP
jgi:hypothetical protein